MGRDAEPSGVRWVPALLVLVPLLAGCAEPPLESEPPCEARAFREARYGNTSAEAVAGALREEGVRTERRAPGIPTTGTPTEVVALDFPLAWSGGVEGLEGQIWDHGEETGNRTLVDVYYLSQGDLVIDRQPDRQLSLVNETAVRAEGALALRLGLAPEEVRSGFVTICHPIPAAGPEATPAFGRLFGG